MRDLWEFVSVLNYGKNILSLKPVDLISIDNVFLENCIAHGMIFKRKNLEYYTTSMWM